MKLAGRPLVLPHLVALLAGYFTAPLCAATPSDDRVVIRAGNVTAAPGDREVLVPVWLEAAKASDLMVGGWRAPMSFDASLLSFQWIEQPSGWFQVKVRSPAEFQASGVIGLEVYYGRDDPDTGTGSDIRDEPIFLRFCVRGDAPSGTYPISIIKQARFKELGDPFQATFTEVSLSATLFSPRLESGSISIAGGPSGSSCPEDLNGGFIRTMPDEKRVLFRLGDASPDPGSREVVVPFSIDVAAGGPSLGSWKAIVRYDPEVLAPIRMEMMKPGYAGTGFRYEPTGRPLDFIEPGTISMGASLLVSALPSKPGPISELNDGLAANLHFCIREGVGPGSYPVEALAYAEDVPPYSKLHAFDETGFERTATPVRSFRPGLQAGRVVIPHGWVPGGECVSTVSPGMVTLSLGRATAAPGQSDVTVPWS